MNHLWHTILTDFSHFNSASALFAFGQVILIDVMLAADNAIVVGALAAGLPPQSRRKVILIGLIAALVLRIVFALGVTALLKFTGLVFAGGLLLLWVAWKMWRELREEQGDSDSETASAPRSFARAAWAVAAADVSMSLDNVLGVAGAAREHPGILIVGLLLSVMLMGLAANLLARVIERYRWIAYIGLAVILFVAGRMIWEGFTDPSTGLISLG